MFPLCERMPLCLVCCLIQAPQIFQSQVSTFGREKSCWHFENLANDVSGRTGKDAGQTDPPFSQVSFPKSLRKSVWKKLHTCHHIPSQNALQKGIQPCFSYFVWCKFLIICKMKSKLLRWYRHAGTSSRNGISGSSLEIAPLKGNWNWKCNFRMVAFLALFLVSTSL